MVYQGPSRGCQTCRKRRVKCDETRPSCMNCLRRKRPCPGFKDDLDTMFKDETAITADRFQRKEKLRDHTPSDVSESEESLIEYPATTVGPCLGADAELFSLCFFFKNYIINPRDPNTRNGFMDHLLPLYSKTTPGSPLSVATSAVAVNLSLMWNSKGPDNSVARGLYTKAVVMTKTALNDPAQSKTDDLLMTVCLLDFYDSLSGRFSNKAAIGSHRDGALALVKHRGSVNFLTRESRGLLFAVRNRLVEAAIERKKAITFNSEVWEDDGQMPHNPATRLDLLGSELANLQEVASGLRCALSRTSSPSTCSVLSDDCSSGNSETALIESVLQQALELDQRMSSWPNSVPACWQPVAITPVDNIHPTIRAAGLYESLCDVYSCLFVAHTFNIWRCNSIALLQVIEKCRLALPADSVSALIISEHYTASRIQSLVDGLCASVPFHLGNRVRPSIPGEDDDIEYPWPAAALKGTRPSSYATNVDNENVPFTQDDHTRAAAFAGGWMMIKSLLGILRAAQPAPGAGPDDPPPLRIRPGQLQWVQGQLRRVQEIYHIPTPKRS